MGYKNWVHPARLYGKVRFALVGLFPYVKPQVVMTGTAGTTACLESEVVTGGETIILTLTNGCFNKNTTAFNAARQAMIDGMDSAQAEAAGWDVEVKGKEVVGAVVRTSDAVVTITLTAQAAYATSASETITVTIPAALLEGQLEPLVAGTFVVTTGS